MGRPRLAGPEFRRRLVAAQVVGALAPRAARGLLADLWFTPWTVSPERALPDGAEHVRVHAGGDWLAGWTVGEGPTVLLVHGWGGNSTDLAAVAGRLAAVGLRAVAVDLPAHGRSPGEQTDLHRLGAAVRGVGGALGDDLVAVVSHSLGGVAVTLALRDGLDVDRVAFIAPPARLETAAEGFTASLRLPQRLHAQLLAVLEDRYGAGVWRDLRAERSVDGLAVDALVVHDRDDPQVPVAAGREVATAYRGTFVQTAGLGHGRILTDPGVLHRVTRHVVQGAARR